MTGTVMTPTKMPPTAKRAAVIAFWGRFRPLKMVAVLVTSVIRSERLMTRVLGVTS